MDWPREGLWIVLHASVAHQCQSSSWRSATASCYPCCVSQGCASAATSLLASVERQRKITCKQCLCSGKFSTTQVSCLLTAWEKWVQGGGGLSSFLTSLGLVIDNWAEKRGGKAFITEPQDFVIHFFFTFLFKSFLMFDIIQHLEMKKGYCTIVLVY